MSGMSANFNKFFRIICVLLILLSLACCSQNTAVASFINSSNTYVIKAGENIDAQTLIDMFVTDTQAQAETDEPPVTTEQIDVIVSPDTSAVTSDTSEQTTDTVYWVKGGEVWHKRSTCPSLSRSKNVFEGTVEDAVLAGKLRVCKRCGT